MANFSGRIGNVLGAQSFVDRFPRLAAVVGAKRAGGGDGDINSLLILRVDQDGMQSHATGARGPFWTGAVTTQTRHFVPGFAAIGGAKQCGIFDPGVNHVRIGQRWFQVPNAFEFPRMLRAVVPLMRGERFAVGTRFIIHELVAFPLWHAFGRGGRLARRGAGLEPVLTAVVGALDHLPEPAARLRSVNPILIHA